jgi:hypothetical protein
LTIVSLAPKKIALRATAASINAKRQPPILWPRRGVVSEATSGNQTKMSATAVKRLSDCPTDIRRVFIKTRVFNPRVVLYSLPAICSHIRIHIVLDSYIDRICYLLIVYLWQPRGLEDKYSKTVGDTSGISERKRGRESRRGTDGESGLMWERAIRGRWQRVRSQSCANSEFRAGVLIGKICERMSIHLH